MVKNWIPKTGFEVKMSTFWLDHKNFHAATRVCEPENRGNSRLIGAHIQIEFAASDRRMADPHRISNRIALTGALPSFTQPYNLQKGPCQTSSTLSDTTACLVSVYSNQTNSWTTRYPPTSSMDNSWADIYLLPFHLVMMQPQSTQNNLRTPTTRQDLIPGRTMFPSLERYIFYISYLFLF
jgi:hypothetical protein